MKKKNGVYYRLWKAKKVKAVVLAVHGMGGHSERYSDMAEFLAAGNISTYSAALRGYGEFADDLKNQNMKSFISDVMKLRTVIEKENRDVPVFILGESMGAVISHMTVLKYKNSFKGLIEVVPVWKDKMLSAGKSLSIILTSLVKPQANINMPFTTKDLTKDRAMIRKIDKDPREVKTSTAKLLVDMGLSQLTAAITPGGIKIPLLMLLAGKDTMGSNKAAISLFNRIKADKKLIVYKNMLHALTIEKGRERVFRDIYAFVRQKSREE